jgi:hypothetical protein
MPASAGALDRGDLAALDGGSGAHHPVKTNRPRNALQGDFPHEFERNPIGGRGSLARLLAHEHSRGPA